MLKPPPAPLSPPPEPPEKLNSLSHQPLARQVTFNLPSTHIDRDSASWRRSPRSRSAARQRRENSTSHRRRLNRPLTGRLLKRAVLDGTIPSAISDTGATSSAGLTSDSDLFQSTGQRSHKIFHVANGTAAPATEVRLLQQPLRAPARNIDIVPSLNGASLLSTSKMADAGYVTVYDGDEVNVYDGRTTQIHVTQAAVLQGWRCPRDRLWRIPLTSTVKNLNTDTLLLDSPDGRSSLNALYNVPPVGEMLGHIDALRDRPPPSHAINHVYELPSVEPAIRYLHGAAGFPTKATWLKAIRAGNFLSWPLINVKNVNKYFPESEETQRGHMRSQRQGVRSTQPAPPPRRNRRRTNQTR